jgi:hypothetical protein
MKVAGVATGGHRPKFFEKLSPEDQKDYEVLREALSSPSRKNRRNKSNETFYEVLESLRRYVLKDSPDGNMRGLVCGILWLERGIAINTHQLSIVTNKCKSSLNGSFQSLGYGTIPSGADVGPQIVRVFPFMKGQFALLRQWTIRQRIDDAQAMTPVPIIQEDEISPCPNPSLLNDACVSSYLNDECTLAEMVQLLIQNKGKSKAPDSRPAIEVPKQPALVEDDPFSFFPKEWNALDRLGFFEDS